ncbi:OLC1v1008624C1 [Oldenlandia corymbosa var. corymbosa]|uniref:OLC1v1008624C1 n=1 Tax=Oldenlandia corymbosa var. corymbosa TaxID=529605 RepID=A0AAV1DNJ5_OLDCO|nr:OLC1v1008624C1 [Oldenlandia corymbosa var. corymbosa]
MRILKWRPGFKFEEDPPIVPIWVSLFDLLIEFLITEVIFSMETAIGKPLKVDAPSLNMTRPSVARFGVEVDLTKEFPKSVKVGKKGKKHDQIFTYEHIPDYCTKCNKIGHKKEDCRVGLQKPLDKKKKAPLKSVDGANQKRSLHVNGVKPHKKTQERAVKNPRAQGATNPSAQDVTAPSSAATADRSIQVGLSSSLSAKEKETIPVDVQASEAANSSKEAPSKTKHSSQIHGSECDKP